jgi:hypothetical protein
MISILLREWDGDCAEITEQGQHLVVGGVIGNLTAGGAVSMIFIYRWYKKQSKHDPMAVDLLPIHLLYLRRNLDKHCLIFC